MSTRNVFLSAGHSNVHGQDMGAEGINGILEGDLTVELRNSVVKELKLLGQYVSTDPDNYVTKNTVAIINALLESKDIAIDIHFNAGPEIARGTEVLTPFKSTQVERDLAKILSENIAAVLSTRNRGVKTEADSARKHLMFMTPNCENILIEVCFITNKLDVLIYLTKKDVVGKVIAKCIYDFLTKQINMKQLNFKVFPSEELTIKVDEQLDLGYDGAHSYNIKNSLGFNNGKAEYDESYQNINFVMKRDDGSMMPGLQSEQLVYILIDRTNKLNAKYPSEFNEEMLRGLNIYLDACKARVEDRLSRGVMGELKK